MSCDSAKTNDFAQRVNHGADEKVAAQLDGVGLAGFGADHGDAAREGLEQGARFGDGLVGAGRNDPEAAFFGDVGPAKDGSGHEIAAAAGVLGGEALRERDADGAAGDVQSAGSKAHPSVRSRRTAPLRAPHRRRAW